MGGPNMNPQMQADQGMNNPVQQQNQKKRFPIFYKDIKFEMQSLFFLGNEYKLLFFDIFLYNFFNMITGETLGAIIFTYFFDKLACYFRNNMGQSNISKKTLIDDCFLI